MILPINDWELHNEIALLWCLERIKMIKGHICFARYNYEQTQKHYCPICEIDTKFLCQNEEWHGYTFTCLKCGNVWMEDGNCNMKLSGPACKAELERKNSYSKNVRIWLNSFKKLKFGLEYNGNWID